MKAIKLFIISVLVFVSVTSAFPQFEQLDTIKTTTFKINVKSKDKFILYDEIDRINFISSGRMKIINRIGEANYINEADINSMDFKTGTYASKGTVIGLISGVVAGTAVLFLVKFESKDDSPVTSNTIKILNPIFKVIASLATVGLSTLTGFIVGANFTKYKNYNLQNLSSEEKEKQVKELLRRYTKK